MCSRGNLRRLYGQAQSGVMLDWQNLDNNLQDGNGKPAVQIRGQTISYTCHCDLRHIPELAESAIRQRGAQPLSDGEISSERGSGDSSLPDFVRYIPGRSVCTSSGARGSL